MAGGRSAPSADHSSKCLRPASPEWRRRHLFPEPAAPISGWRHRRPLPAAGAGEGGRLICVDGIWGGPVAGSDAACADASCQLRRPAGWQLRDGGDEPPPEPTEPAGTRRARSHIHFRAERAACASDTAHQHFRRIMRSEDGAPEVPQLSSPASRTEKSASRARKLHVSRAISERRAVIITTSRR